MERDINRVTGEIVDAALKVHRLTGPGLLESVYEAILARELERRSLSIERQASIAFDFDGMHFDDGLKVDLLVNQSVVVELKSVDIILPLHKKQVLTYLRLLNLNVGLLLNFGAGTMKEGIRRIVDDYRPPEDTRERLPVVSPKQE
jgi:iron complex transport system substrate-binding protein